MTSETWVKCVRVISSARTSHIRAIIGTITVDAFATRVIPPKMIKAATIVRITAKTMTSVPNAVENAAVALFA